ncbi:MAG TPA: BlaI/MecI/CopY family transcriptional regulator [Thermoplasmata archaeon]|nr:BlaI/MecI/CopY family transcriptional regulator [Thermoplasmata archaeon]
MELGDLELAVLRAVRTLGEASSGDVYDEVRKSRDVAYTSVTTTLYRLVDKDLITVRRQSEKRVFYRIKDGRAYRKVMATMVDSLLDTFGGAAVSYLLENPDRLEPAQEATLRNEVKQRRKKESLHA